MANRNSGSLGIIAWSWCLAKATGLSQQRNVIKLKHCLHCLPQISSQQWSAALGRSSTRGFPKYLHPPKKWPKLTIPTAAQIKPLRDHAMNQPPPIAKFKIRSAPVPSAATAASKGRLRKVGQSGLQEMAWFVGCHAANICQNHLKWFYWDMSISVAKVTQIPYSEALPQSCWRAEAGSIGIQSLRNEGHWSSR